MELFAVKKTIFTFVIALILSLFLVACGGGSSDSGGTNQTNNNQAQLENLGKSLYFDENLSQLLGSLVPAVIYLKRALLILISYPQHLRVLVLAFLATVTPQRPVMLPIFLNFS